MFWALRGLLCRVRQVVVECLGGLEEEEKDEGEV